MVICRCTLRADWLTPWMPPLSAATPCRVLGLRVQGSRVGGLKIRDRVSILGSWVKNLRFGVKGSEFRVWRLGFRVSGLGIRVGF